MYRRILILCCVLLVALTQSGCFGLIVGYSHNLQYCCERLLRHIVKEDIKYSELSEV
jgi:hypothetical protein